VERGFDEELAAISSSLPMIVRLTHRTVDAMEARPGSAFFDRPEQEWTDDMDSIRAWLDSTWIRGRHLIHFLLNWGGRDTVRADEYLPGWRLTDDELRTALVGFAKQASKIVAHQLRQPDAQPGLWSGMPAIVLLGFEDLLSAAPEGHVLHEALDEAVALAQRLREERTVERIKRFGPAVLGMDPRPAAE
jgi:hypothetical protein